MTVEAAGLWKWTLMQNNKSSLPGNRMVAEFNGDCNFEGTSTVSNYGTASESDEFAFPFLFPFPFPFPCPFPSFLVLPLPAFLSKVRPPISAVVHAVTLSKKHQRSSTLEEKGLKNEGRH